MVDRAQIEQIRNQWSIWKMCSNQRIQITIFEGVIVKIKKFPGKLRMFMPELKQQGSK
jgi:hypothetical protein